LPIASKTLEIAEFVGVYAIEQVKHNCLIYLNFKFLFVYKILMSYIVLNSSKQTNVYLICLNHFPGLAFSQFIFKPKISLLYFECE